MTIPSRPLEVGDAVRITWPDKPGLRIEGEVTSLQRPREMPRLRVLPEKGSAWLSPEYDVDHVAERFKELRVESVAGITYTTNVPIEPEGMAQVELTYFALACPGRWCDVSGETINLEFAERVQ